MLPINHFPTHPHYLIAQSQMTFSGCSLPSSKQSNNGVLPEADRGHLQPPVVLEATQELRGTCSPGGARSHPGAERHLQPSAVLEATLGAEGHLQPRRCSKPPRS